MKKDIPEIKDVLMVDAHPDDVLHMQFEDYKKKGDSHLKNIEWIDFNENTEDKKMLTNFFNFTLTEERVRERLEELANESIERGNPSVDLAAMLLNKVISPEYFDKHTKKLGK